MTLEEKDECRPELFFFFLINVESNGNSIFAISVFDSFLSALNLIAEKIGIELVVGRTTEVT